MPWALLPISLSLPDRAFAQRLYPTVAPSTAASTHFAWSAPAADSVSRKDFRWLGTIIGAAVGGTLGHLIGRAIPRK
jgi:uncharacterized protein YfiM (DUF2279 family)